MYPAHYAQISPEKPAAINSNSGEILTYRELERRSSRLAQLLYQQGLRRGDNISIFMENHLRYFEVVWAAFRSGLTGQLMVGFNRRFSPLAQRAKEFFSGRETPLSMLYRVNAGRIPKDHWLQNDQEGGGRIVGEVCHFIDLMVFLTESLPASVFAESVSAKSSKIVDADSVFITLKFADGSNGVVAYLGEGDKGLAKERVEIFGAGKSFVLDDFRRATLYQNGREEQVNLKTQDKGQQAQVRAVCASLIEGGSVPITLDELAATTRATFRVLDSLRERRPFEV
jgi:polar amino acid transport system substrate-binding protein